jgi:hypothetical protein
MSKNPFCSTLSSTTTIMKGRFILNLAVFSTTFDIARSSAVAEFPDVQDFLSSNLTEQTNVKRGFHEEKPLFSFVDEHPSDAFWSCPYYPSRL